MSNQFIFSHRENKEQKIIFFKIKNNEVYEKKSP
tara:strand:+ start:727 stop:828 length:102 start_codon:yes stop_codon:yes gene_type:complete